jgi:hypothetical protein
VLAGISAYASAQFSAGAVGLQVGEIVLLAAVAWFALRPFVRWLLTRMPITDGHVPPNLMTIILCLIFAMGICTTSSAFSRSSAAS